MPNYATNFLTITGDLKQVEKCVEEFTTVHEPEHRKAHNGDLIYKPEMTLTEQLDKQEKGEPTYAWYNKETDTFTFMPTEESRKGIPEGWKPDMSERTIQFPDFNKAIPEPDNLFRGSLGPKEREMCEKEGIPNWWDWRCDNWGTKWNSSDFYDNGGEYIFTTAWCGVPNVIEAMSKKFPDLTFEYRADHEEGGGEYYTFGGEE